MQELRGSTLGGTLETEREVPHVIKLGNERSVDFKMAEKESDYEHFLGLRKNVSGSKRNSNLNIIINKRHNSY